jgi:NarL family two-component system response regulator LiaR
MTTPAPTRVVIADDHALVRDGLAEIIGAQSDFEVVGQASDGVEAVARTRELKPDVVLMDLTMPSMDGLTATRILTSFKHEWKIVMLTFDADRTGLLNAISAGAAGYLVKTMHSADLIRALRGMRDGEPPLAPKLAGHVIDELRRLSAQPAQPSADRVPALTDRERDVLNLVAKGAGDKQVARALSLSLYTVKAHMRNILAKLPVDGRQQAARYARREGLL